MAKTIELKGKDNVVNNRGGWREQATTFEVELLFKDDMEFCEFSTFPPRYYYYYSKTYY